MLFFDDQKLIFSVLVLKKDFLHNHETICSVVSETTFFDTRELMFSAFENVHLCDNQKPTFFLLSYSEKIE